MNLSKKSTVSSTLAVLTPGAARRSECARAAVQAPARKTIRLKARAFRNVPASDKSTRDQSTMRRSSVSKRQKAIFLTPRSNESTSGALTSAASVASLLLLLVTDLLFDFVAVFVTTAAVATVDAALVLRVLVAVGEAIAGAATTLLAFSARDAARVAN